jgi:hypothetical protein
MTKSECLLLADLGRSDEHNSAEMEKSRNIMTYSVRPIADIDGIWF